MLCSWTCLRKQQQTLHYFYTANIFTLWAYYPDHHKLLRLVLQYLNVNKDHHIPTEGAPGTNHGEGWVLGGV